MKKKTMPDVCPCLWQDGVLFADCCGRYIAGTALAPTAEALMRSRYSAFVKEAGDYLLQTWHPSTRPTAMEFEERGKVISICLKVENINPEQSKPALVVPPPLYLVPMCCEAFAIKNSALDMFSGESSSTSFGLLTISF